jgi:hypothetical protein
VGQEICYCYKCQRRVVGAEFVSGKAFQVGNHVSCSACAAELLQTLGPDERQQLLSKMFRATQDRQSHTSGALQAQADPQQPGSTRSLRANRQSTVRIPVVDAAPPPGNPRMMAIALGGSLVVVAFGALALFFMGGKERRDSARTSEEPAPSTERHAAPSPAAAPAPSAAHEAARTAIRKARDVASRNPKDLEGQIGAWKEAADLAAGTPSSAEVRRELDAVLERRKAAIPAEWAELDAKAKAHEVKEEYQAAIDLLQSARLRYSVPEWTQPLDRRVGELYGSVARRAAAPPQAAELVRTTPPAPPRAETPRPAPSPAELRWEAALGRASARDYPAALEQLKDAAADQDALRAAAAVLQESQDLIARWPRGQSLAVEAPEHVEGALLRAEPGRVAIKQAAGPAWVEIGDITPACLAELFRARAAKKPDDDRAAALFCLLEGDVLAAKTIAGAGADRIPEKYWQYGAKVADLRQSPDIQARESEARELWKASEDGQTDYARALPSVESCRKLLSDYAGTGFVERNRAAIASRAAGPKDYLFCPDNLKPAGSWKAGRSAKADSFWTCEKDSIGNYIDLGFSAFPGIEYRCWVYAGACCQETFAFSAQGTEMKTPKDAMPAEPGTNVLVPVRNTIVGLKKAHSMHNGPKAPSQWAWISVPLPKYASSGAKVVRLVGEQQGFSVAYAAVTAQKDPPRDADLKEFERTWKELAGARKLAPPPPVVRPGKLVCAEDFSKGRGRFTGGGEIVDADLPGKKALAVPPSGSSVSGWSVVIRPSTIVRFRVKSLVNLPYFECMGRVESRNENAWYHVTNLKAGESRSVEFKMGDMHLKWDGATIMGERVEWILFYYVNQPADARVLITDFEIRD